MGPETNYELLLGLKPMLSCYTVSEMRKPP